MHAYPGRLAAGLIAATLFALAGPVPAATNSAKYRFEGNKNMSLDLSVAEVRAEEIRFDWPATRLGMKTGYKATVKLVNGSTGQVRIGLGLVLFDRDGKLVGVGTTGTKLGTIDPGDEATFSIDFNHVTERLEQANQFQLVVETR